MPNVILLSLLSISLHIDYSELSWCQYIYDSKNYTTSPKTTLLFPASFLFSNLVFVYHLSPLIAITV